MEKHELLKKMMFDINNDEYYNGAVFYGDNDDLFAFHEGNLHVLEGAADLSWFTVHFTPEEKQAVERIEKELQLNRWTFLPIRGEVVYSLQSLIEYYTMDEDYDEDAESDDDLAASTEIDEIERLMAVFEDENSIFYHREDRFLELFVYPEVEISGAPYVRCDWDHDDAYDYDLPYSTGVCDLLYDIVVGMDSFVELDCVENNCNLTAEEKEQIYDHWIEILSQIDNYIVR